MFYAIIMPNIYLYSYCEIIRRHCQKRGFLWFYSSKFLKTWHNVNKHKIDLLVNKLMGASPTFIKVKNITPNNLKTFLYI